MDTPQEMNPLESFCEELETLAITQSRRLINTNLYTKSLLSTLPVALISSDVDGMVQVANNAAEEMLQITLKSARGSSLVDLFHLSPSIVENIQKAWNEESPVSVNSLDMILEDGQQKVVNIHVQLLYDEDRARIGTLVAIEDQTYITFLRDSFKQHALTPSDGDIVANSPKMKKIVKQISELGADGGPVLFSGSPGSGKSFLAAKLHKSRGLDSQAPFIMVDCREMDPAKSKEVLLGSAEKMQGEADSIRFKSLTDYGTVHLAERGTLVLVNFDALGPDSLEAVNDFIDQVGEGVPNVPECRVVATTEVDLNELGNREEFFKPLLDRLLENHIAVPTLRDRRKDILPLANAFLAEQADGEPKTLSKGAANSLLTKPYNQNNVKELRDAIELAVLVADGDIIRSEHIFTGPMEEEASYEIDLTEFALVRFLINDKTLFMLRHGVLAFFGVLIGMSLFFPERLPGVVSNHLVWGMWWVFLVLAFLLLGRVWCTVCPLSTAGRIASRIWSLASPPPGFLKTHGLYLIPIGFVLIIWAEHFFHMTTNPRATGFLLIALISLAVLFALFFERETWCRYLCPLGNFGGIFSLSAILFVRSNSNVCSTLCNTHNCVKGSDEYDGCPVFHHPLFAKNAQICKLCFNCLKSCPHGSARLYLRPPLVRIWQQLDIAEAIGFFALVLFFLAPCLLATESVPLFMQKGAFTWAAVASILLAVGCRYLLPGMLFGDHELKLVNTTRLILVMLLLAWGPFAAFQFGHIPGLNELFVVSGQQGGLPSAMSDHGISVLVLVQLGVIWFGALLALAALVGIARRVKSEGGSLAGRSWYFILGIFLIYPMLSSWIVI